MTERGPLTERILRLANRRRMYQRTVAELAGMPAYTFHARVKSDAWTWQEVCDIATALNERVDVLLDVSEAL